MFVDNKLNEMMSLVEDIVREEPTKWIAGKDWVQYSGPYFDDKEYKNAIKCILDGWLVLGKYGLQFENKFPKLLGKDLGLLTNSGSSANLLMVSFLKSKSGFGLPDGTKIATPVAGFPTTINPIIQNNFKPVFIDIEFPSMNIDLDQLEQACEKDSDIRAVIFAHVLGNPPNMDRLMGIVDKYDLILLEDCCDALGGTYKNKPLGSFGRLSSCSFYPAHHITLGEGGFVATNDLADERILRSFREWGRSCYCVGKNNLLKNGTCDKRFCNWLPSVPDVVVDHKYVYQEVGYNLKPIEVQAAIGMAQIDKIDDITDRRKRNFNLIYEIFKPYEKYFILPKATEGSDPSWFAFPITLKDTAPFSRYDICEFLESHKIQTRQYFGGNILLQPAYSDYNVDGNAFDQYPSASKTTVDTFFLGTSPVITENQIAWIGEVLDNFMEKFNV